jgi:hypothetical protein
LISRTKVTSQDQKDVNKEIKNIRRDLIFNEYPQEFVDLIAKSSRRNRPSSDIIYKGMVISNMLMLFLKNSDALGTVPMSEPYANLNIHFVGH